MLCPLCHQRKAKRGCPALGKQICSVCCGTKRLIEIKCPADCGYLAAAAGHPPAVVQRQLEFDRMVLLPLLKDLSERQARLFLMMAAVTARHQGEVLQQIRDDDIQQAAAALASTLETAARGIVYEHQPASLPASRLMAELKTALDELARNAGFAVERDAAIALRRLEQAAKTLLQLDPNSNELQALFVRVLAPSPGAKGPDAPAEPASTLIIPQGG